jgi:D-glycero-D-manno-heptose 1,7-bisphosphate phosphatase
MGRIRVNRRKAVFLDRDGVLLKAKIRDGKPFSASSINEFELTVDAKTACDRLRSAGFLLILVTNQPDVARGNISRNSVDQINTRLQAELLLDDVVVCDHDDEDNCNCRKPLPGMLDQAAVTHRIDLTISYIIGDRWKDISAGEAADCKTVWIDYSYTERKPTTASFRAISLLDAVSWIEAQNMIPGSKENNSQ